MNKRVVTFGDIMMRLSTPGFSRFQQANQFNVLYAGSEGNVASSLAILGVPSVHVTRFPNNDFGQAATQALKKIGVNTQHIIYGEERIGVYFLE
ncbi:MAG TPA: PfkB family carbohydrate kinase, partial [Cyclobacteriaceae bacterium]